MFTSIRFKVLSVASGLVLAMLVLVLVGAHERRSADESLSRLSGEIVPAAMAFARLEASLG